MALEETTIDEFVPDDVEIAAWEVISALLPELSVIYAGQNHHRPPMPYATIQVIGRTRVGQPTISEIDDDGRQVYHQVNQGSISVRVFGGQARKHLDNLNTRFTKITSRDIMRKNRFTIFGQSSVNDAPTVRDTLFIEPGAFLDAQWRYTARYYDDVGIIDTVNAHGEIGETPVNFTIDITYSGV